MSQYLKKDLGKLGGKTKTVTGGEGEHFFKNNMAGIAIVRLWAVKITFQRVLRRHVNDI